MAENEESNVGAVGSGWRGERVRGIVETLRGGALWGAGLRKSHGRVVVVGVEAQPLPSVTHVFCESRAEGVRRTGGAGFVEGTRVQLVQRHRGDGRAVHGQGVASVAGEVRQGIGSRHRGLVHLGLIFLTAVILQEQHETELIRSHEKHQSTTRDTVWTELLLLLSFEIHSRSGLICSFIIMGIICRGWGVRTPTII